MAVRRHFNDVIAAGIGVRAIENPIDSPGATTPDGGGPCRLRLQVGLRGGWPSAQTALGSRTDRRGRVLTGRDQSTRCPGLYAAGDATRGPQFAIAAAAEGTVAAWAIHEDLMAEDAREDAARTARRAHEKTPPRT